VVKPNAIWGQSRIEQKPEYGTNSKRFPDWVEQVLMVYGQKAEDTGTTRWIKVGEDNGRGEKIQGRKIKVQRRGNGKANKKEQERAVLG